MSDFAFAGKTFELHMEDGVVFRNTYGPEGNTLRYREIDGATEGASEDVKVHVAEVGRRMYLLGWNEISGTAVTHVMDFKTSTVTAFWSFPDGGGRTGQIHTATFKEIG